MTSRNQLIAQQRNDFRPRQLRCSLSARLSASRSEVHIDEELTLKFKTLRHRTDEPYKTKDIQHQRPLLGVQHRQDERAPTPRPCELWRSAPGTSAHHGKRRVVCQPNFGWQLWKRNGYICVYFNWPPGPNPVVAISTRVGPGSRLVMQVTLLAVLCLDEILYCPLLLCTVEITSNSNTSQANEYKSTKSGRVAMRLPCCHFVFCGRFPPE